MSNPAPAPFAQPCYIQAPKTRRFKLYFGSSAAGDTTVPFEGDALRPFVIGPKQSLSLKVAFVAPTGDDPDYLFSDYQDTVTVYSKDSTISVLLYAVREKENDDDGFQPSSASLQSRTLPRPRDSAFAALLVRGGGDNGDDGDDNEDGDKGEKEEGKVAEAGKENERLFSVNTAVAKGKVVGFEEKTLEQREEKEEHQEQQQQEQEMPGRMQQVLRETRARPPGTSSVAASTVSAVSEKERELPAALRALLAPVESSEDAMSIIAKMRGGRRRASQTGGIGGGGPGGEFASFDALVRKSTSKVAKAKHKEAPPLPLSSDGKRAAVPTTDDEVAFYKSFIKEQKMKKLRAEYGEAAEDVYRALNDVEKSEATSVEVKAKDAAKAARKRMQMRDDAYRKTNAVAARMCDIARGKHGPKKVGKKGGARGDKAKGEDDEAGSAIDWSAMKQSLQAYEHDEEQLDALASSPLNSPGAGAAVTDEDKEDDLSWFMSQVVKK